MTSSLPSLLNIGTIRAIFMHAGSMPWSNDRLNTLHNGIQIELATYYTSNSS